MRFNALGLGNYAFGNMPNFALLRSKYCLLCHAGNNDKHAEPVEVFHLLVEPRCYDSARLVLHVRIIQLFTFVLDLDLALPLLVFCRLHMEITFVQTFFLMCNAWRVMKSLQQGWYKSPSHRGSLLTCKLKCLGKAVKVIGEWNAEYHVTYSHQISIEQLPLA